MDTVTHANGPVPEQVLCGRPRETSPLDWTVTCVDCKRLASLAGVIL